MQLVRPAEIYKDSFIEAAKEFKTEKEGLGKQEKIDIQDLEKDFGTFVEKQLSQAEGKNLPRGYVPMTHYWLIDGGVYIGKLRIRHFLNEHLQNFGGHIGYSIRPSKRGRGYGNQILALALPEAKKLGITRALLTCDVSNAASRKIIEKNGGVLENEVPNPETEVNKLRFWIEIK